MGLLGEFARDVLGDEEDDDVPGPFDGPHKSLGETLREIWGGRGHG